VDVLIEEFLLFGEVEEWQLSSELGNRGNRVLIVRERRQFELTLLCLFLVLFVHDELLTTTFPSPILASASADALLCCCKSYKKLIQESFLGFALILKGFLEILSPDPTRQIPLIRHTFVP
jgi:hypothetical protein